jgi:hypothetical protein
MLLTVYFDETGHARDPNVSVVGIAGFVAPSHRWEVFETDWRLMLSKFGVSELHMRLLAHSKKDFQGWGESNSRAFLSIAVDILRTTGALPLGSMVDMVTFRQLDERAQEAFKDPYYMALQACLDSALEYAQSRDDKIKIVFDKAGELAGSAKTLVDLFIPGHSLGHRVEAVKFSNSKESLPLQAADFLSYELGRRLKERAASPLSIPRWELNELRKLSIAIQGFRWFRYWNADKLKREEQRFLSLLEYEKKMREERSDDDKDSEKIDPEESDPKAP